MRVLHVNAGNLYGGIETLLVTLARCRHLCPEMEPSFALCFEGRLSKELTEAGVRVHVLGNVRISRPWTVLRARRTFRQLLHDESFDIVLTHGSWSHAIFGSEATRAKIVLVSWLHGVVNGRHGLEYWAGRTAPDLAICNSRFTAGHADKLFAGVRKEVVYLPLAAPSGLESAREAIRSELGADNETVVILQASRMEELKGQEMLLAALARLRAFPNWTCWIAGGAQRIQERSYMALLQNQVTALDLSDRVRFLGQRSDIPVLMAAADIFCQPNRSAEGFGLTFVESLQAGLPVISTRIGGAMEIIDEHCGILVPAGDVAALADALRRLIEDPRERGRLSSSGPSRAKALCDPAMQLEQLHGTLRRIAGQASPTPTVWRHA